MSATPDSTLGDCSRTIAELRGELAECKAERDAALAREVAAAEVLQVIHSSRGDAAPVFDTMLDKAIRLCEATHSHLFTYDGERFTPPQPAVIGATSNGRGRPVCTAISKRSVGANQARRADRPCWTIFREEEVYRAVPTFRHSAELRGVRSQITVALLKDNVLLGAMVVYRQEVHPFTDNRIALLQNFAVQAIIAMENARLITETREALEQQTTTTEVLQVINGSPGDLHRCSMRCWRKRRGCVGRHSAFSEPGMARVSIFPPRMATAVPRRIARYGENLGALGGANDRICGCYGAQVKDIVHSDIPSPWALLW
jgi:GAF domain-containing protein